MSEPLLIEVILTNAKAVRALGLVAEVLDDVAEDMPWRDDVKRAAKAAIYAMKHIRVEVEVSPQ